MMAFSAHSLDVKVMTRTVTKVVIVLMTALPGLPFMVTIKTRKKIWVRHPACLD